MDLQVFLRVCWRFRVIVAVGLVFATTLALLSYVKVGFAHGKPTLSYRQNEQYVSYATFLVTQRGFPWGRSDADSPVQAAPATGGQQTQTPVVPGGSTPHFATASRLSDLATLYAQLVWSDPVLNLVRRRHGPIHGEIRAVPVLALQNQGNTLPLVQVAGLASTPAGAVDLARRDLDAFGTYLTRMQQANGVPADRRVLVSVVDKPAPAKIWQSRGTTRPILIFLTLLLAVVGFVFVLENMRPRIRRIAAEPLSADSASDAA